MKNIKVEQKDGKLYIECDLSADHGKSSSGKTMIVASSEGNQPVGTHKNGKPVILGLNLYFKP